MKAALLTLFFTLAIFGISYCQEIKMKFLTKSIWRMTMEEADSYQDGDIITLSKWKRNKDIPWSSTKTAYDFSKNGQFKFILKPMGISFDQSSSNWHLTEVNNIILVQTGDSNFKLEIITLTKDKLLFHYTEK
jgi:hypothetical protein